MDNKFTPGPWCYRSIAASKYHRQDHCYVYVGESDNHGNPIARVVMGAPRALHSNMEEIEANARLIVAAPDMLAVLQAIENASSYEDQGREGCTYGDTSYDSVSAAHGYNLAIAVIREKLGNILDKALNG